MWSLQRYTLHVYSGLLCPYHFQFLSLYPAIHHFLPSWYFLPQMEPIEMFTSGHWCWRETKIKRLTIATYLTAKWTMTMFLYTQKSAMFLYTGFHFLDENIWSKLELSCREKFSTLFKIPVSERKHKNLINSISISHLFWPILPARQYFHTRWQTSVIPFQPIHIPR